jgi:hypothetical protein
VSTAPDPYEGLNTEDRRALLEAEWRGDRMKLEALDRGDFEEYLELHGGHERLPAFVEFLAEWGHGSVPDADYWRLLAFTWQHHDFVYHSLAVWRMLFRSPRPGREHLMTSSERERLAALPERVTAHRGFSDRRGRAGIAWTLDREGAELFARRFESLQGGAYVATVTVPRERVLAYFGERNESEILLPDLRGYRPQVAGLGRSLTLC